MGREKGDICNIFNKDLKRKKKTLPSEHSQHFVQICISLRNLYFQWGGDYILELGALLGGQRRSQFPDITKTAAEGWQHLSS